MTNRMLLVFALLAITGSALHSQGTMAPLPPHASLYAIYARGMWFEAPKDFTIVGLRVPVEVTTPQCLQVVRTVLPPDGGTSAQTANFTTLHYSTNGTPGIVIAVNIQVTQGEYIGILGGGVNNATNDDTSYGSGPFASSIDGLPISLYRFGFQGQIGASAATTVWGQLTGQIGRVEMYYQVGPTLGVIAPGGTAHSVYATDEGPGGNGIQAASFEIEANDHDDVPLMALTGVEIEATGSGDDSISFTSVGLYRRDDTNTGGFDHTLDHLIGILQNFAVDDGKILFQVPSGTEQQFDKSESKTYFIVVRLAGTALPGDTFNFIVSDLILTGPGAQAADVPSPVINGLIIAAPEFEFVDDSPQQAAAALLGSTGNVCQVFDLEYLGGPDDRPGDITVSGLGSADESTDLDSVQLWYDADQSGGFDPLLDILIDTQNYTQDNGDVTFNMSSHPVFTALESRRFFVVYNLGLTAGNNATFKCFVSGMSTTAFGGNAAGLPAPSGGTEGLTVLANVLLADLNGPVGAINVHGNTTGPHGDGELLADVTVSATHGSSWTVNALTFQATGTGTHDTAFSELALYLDNGGGSWDGAAVDTLAAPTKSAFSSSEVTFDLNDTNFPAGTAKRFFLVGKMNGSAQTGETFNASLQHIDANLPAGGAINGVPTIASTALIIDSAAVTVANAPNQPDEIWHRQGSAQHYVVGKFRLMALNDAVTVNGFMLTTGGTGNWATDVDVNSGVEVWLDDGTPTFDAGADTLIFSGGGGATVNCLFTTPLSMPLSSTADLWIRIGLTDVAGLGAINDAVTYTAEITSIADVHTGSAVVLASNAPATTPLGAIEFNVSSFSPTSDLPAGGKQITIDGTGFVAPVTVTIGGITCPGTATASPAGTQITGIQVPTGGGTSLPIVVRSGKLPPQTLTQTFSYRNISTGGSGSGSSGCASGNTPALPWTASLLALGMAVCAAVRVRRRVA